MKIKHLFLILFSSMLAAQTKQLWAQNSDRTLVGITSSTQKQVRTGAPIYFRIADSGLDLDFKHNRNNLDALLRSINAIVADTNYIIQNFTVTGAASPDGNVARNNELAGQRAQVLAAWLTANVKGSTGKIKIVNGGENWAALQEMVAASQMPYRNEVLILMDAYPTDRETLKYLLKTYADGVPWRWMSDNIFPELRMGAGLSKTTEILSAASLENWQVLRRLVMADNKVLSVQEKHDVLYIIDNMTDATVSEQALRNLNFGSTYISIRQNMFSAMLNTIDNRTIDNWAFIGEKVAACNMKDKAAVLRIIDKVPVYEGREKQLRQLSSGAAYQYIQDNIFPQLLITSRRLGERNWELLGKLLEVSHYSNKDQLLDLIRSPYSLIEKENRLRTINSGQDYTYIYSVLVPELLGLLTPTAQDNWRQMERVIENSTFFNENRILDIIRNTSTADARQGAIQALDHGATFGVIQAKLFPLMLTATQTAQTSISGSGITLIYELSPAARARAALLAQQSKATEQQTQNQKINIAYKLSLKKKTLRPLLNIKTDLVQWAGVSSAFDGLHTYTPNLSLEFLFADRWSVEVGVSYSNWNAFTGSKELWAVSQGWIEPRIYFGKPGRFRGVYAGFFALYGSYDTQQGTIGRTGTHVNMGLSVGYVQTLSRSWFLELNVRGGYRIGTGALYDMVDQHYYYNRNDNTNAFAPQIRLNVIYRIFRNSR